MTSASNSMITRCPKCATAFRVTQSQLQSAQGAVRCGSCLHVFKAQEYLISDKNTNTSTSVPHAKPGANTASKPTIANNKPATAASAPVAAPKVAASPSKTTPIAPKPLATPSSATIKAPSKPGLANIATQNKSLPGTPNVSLKKPDFSNNLSAKTTPAGLPPFGKTLQIDDSDDILISDDMEEQPPEVGKYDSDDFMGAIPAPVSTETSLFERKQRADDKDEQKAETDESWAEILLAEDEDITSLKVARPTTQEQGNNPTDNKASATAKHTDTPGKGNPPPGVAPATKPKTVSAAEPPKLMFSFVAETDAAQHQEPPQNDELQLSEELNRLPSHQGFKPATTKTSKAAPKSPTTAQKSLANQIAAEEEPAKRQIKTQPKIRAYDGSRAALLMNIMPAPIEFTAKTVRRWYQRKLWPSLSILALIALAIQIAWFKFDYLSRIEPYRTAYLFACPYLGCQVPTLVDTRQITTSNLVVREHPDITGALAVDVMIINSAAFDQPFPNLVLVFSDINDKTVASRRFAPKDYLGGELVGSELMPQNQKVYITLDLVDPGAEAVNYRIYIER